MSEPTASSPATRAAHVAAFGLLYALAAALARTVLGRPAGVPVGLEFYAGAAVAFPFDVLLGALLAIPIARQPQSFLVRVMCGVPAMLLLALHVAVTPRLPGAVSRTHLELSGPPALGAGLMLGAALLAGLSPLAARLEARYATRGGRIADAVALGLLACLAIGASIGAYGELYAGAVHPTWHMALEPEGRSAPAADPVQNTRHAEGHDHEGHEHHEGEPHRRYAPGDVLAANEDAPVDDGRPPGDVRVMLSVLHQGDAHEPVPDTAYPYCVEAARPAEPPPAGEALPSVIVLLLRDVGMRELALDLPSGDPVMPMLRRLSTEGVLFDEVMAAGERDEDVLLALLSGQPPSPESPVMTDVALPYLPGVARDLRERGYRTAFFDGARDVRTFRQSYLRMVGFETLDVPPLSAPPARSDQDTYASLRAWLSQEGSAPRFAMVHALGRTDIEVSAATLLTDFDSLRARLAHTDAQLEAFYTWYVQNERARGTILMVMGDHPSPVVFPDDPPTPTTIDGHELHFRVPLIVTGLAPEQESALRERSSRLGAQTDMPRTLLGLARDERLGCYFGRDLFAGGEWPVRRAPLSFGGDSRQFLVAHDGDIRWLFNTLTRGYRIHDRAADPRLERDLFSEDDPELPRMREYMLSHLLVQRYVRQRRRYLPVPELPEAERPARATPRRISDRGLLAGPPPPDQPPLRQSHEEVEAAAAAGFESILLDLRMTREGDFITIGSSELLQLGDGVNVHVDDVSREQLATLRRPAPTIAELLQRHPGMRFVFQLRPPVRAELRDAWYVKMVETFRALPPERVMLLTSDPALAGLLAGALRDARIEVGLAQTPNDVEGALAWLQTVRALELPWVFFPPAAVDASVLDTAQRWGVRVGLSGVSGANAVLRLMSADAAPSAYVASRAFLLEARPPRSPRTP